MRSTYFFAVVALGCNGGGTPSGPAPDAAGVPDGAPTIDGGGTTDDAAIADAATDDGGMPTPDGGTTTSCTTVLAPKMNPIVPPHPAIPWSRCGGYGSGTVASVNGAETLARAVIVTEAGDAVVVSLPSMTELASFTHATGPVSFAALSPDGDMLATVDDPRGEVALWVVDTGVLFRRMSRPPAWPSSQRLGAAAFSHDGQRLAVISGDRVDVWDLPSGELLPISARTDLGGGARVAFAKGDTRLVLGRFMYFGNGPYAGWGQVDIVDTLDGGNPVRLDYNFYISLPYLAVSADTEVVAIAGDGSGDGNVALFDAGTGAPLPVAPITGLPLALDGNRIAVREANAITHRRISDGALLASVPATGVGPSAVKLEFESGLALVGALDGVTAIHFDDGVTGAACTVGALDASDTLTGVALSSDDQTLVTTSSEGIRQVWDAATGALESTPPPSDLVVPSATSQDGRMIAIPDAASTFHVEDVATGEVIWTFGPHPTRVTGLDWGGVTRIASSAEREPVDRWEFEPSVRVWSTTLVTMEQALPGIDNGPALFNSTLGHLFVTGRSSVTRWCK